MAIKLSKSSTFGVDATYHNVGHVQIDYRKKIAHVQIFGYADKAARDAEAEPLVVNQCYFSGADFDFEGREVTRAQLYARLIETPEWMDGVAV